MNNCIFCKIIKNEIPSKTIFEDEYLKVFLDVNPNENGHMLIVPKEHIRDFYELDDNLIIHINKVAKLMSDIVYKKLKCDGIKLITNQGICQDVKHFHLHLIPVYSSKQELISIDEIYNTLKKED